VRRRHVVAAGLLFTLVAAGGGVAMAASQHSHPLPPRPLFSGQLLLPGHSAHGEVTIRSTSVSVRPYLQLSDIKQRCFGAGCRRSTPVLASALMLSATDSSGHSLSVPLAKAQRRVVLPGGVISAHHNRTYQLTLSLPTWAGNSYQGLRVTGKARWGGMNAAGAVLSSSGFVPSGSPFTRRDLLGVIAVVGSLIGLGATMVETTQRRPPREVSR
jgi:hypothetical protein